MFLFTKEFFKSLNKVQRDSFFQMNFSNTFLVIFCFNTLDFL